MKGREEVAIKKIRVKNFKSFNELEVELDKLNVLIGANASGKSNFIKIFQFLGDIVKFGLDNAISMQGGIEYLKNINIGKSENLSITIVSDPLRLRPGLYWGPSRELLRGDLIMDETIYEFALEFNQRGPPGFKVVKDELTQKLKFKRGGAAEEKAIVGEIVCSNVDGKVNIDLSEGIPAKVKRIFPTFMTEHKLTSKTLLLETPFFSISRLDKIASNISIYDFDPKLPKQITPITGKAELEEDGSNLPIILKNIIENKNLKRKFFNLLKDLLPFIDDIGVDRFAYKSLLVKLREIYSKEQLPAFLISDGTINITALIVALYFERKPIIIIEEPERNIHPHLISKVMEMARDASQKKQIIITTHNPEVVKNAGLENILLISRDEEGFSTISRPADKEEIKTFLKNEIGIEELYVQNLLGE